MKIAIGADHAGFALKQHLVATLTRLGHQVDDLGTHDTQPVDYPVICADVARAVVNHRADRGIVIGGSGQGEQTGTGAEGIAGMHGGELAQGRRAVNSGHFRVAIAARK